MTDIDDRNKRIGKLTNIRITGVHASNMLRDLMPVLEQMRAIYLDDLVENTRANKAPDELNTWRLVVLKDIQDFLREQASRGAGAARKLDKLTNAGGSDT